VTLYAHIDLDLDSADNLILSGKSVKQGDLISRHLYSGTVGGPHLHFEIRYYRPGDKGNEEFYGVPGFGNNTLTDPSAGSWSYGYWNPSVGFGFGNPMNHLQTSATKSKSYDFASDIKICPIPAEDLVTLTLAKIYPAVHCSVFDISGVLLDQKTIISSSTVVLDLTGYRPGMYFIDLVLEKGENNCFRVIRE
jgi:hypothetical protein